MKFSVVAASLLASANSQTSPKLDAKCVMENDVEKLVIDIPYPDAPNANILRLAAGDCTEANYETKVLDSAGNNGGSMDIDTVNDIIHITLPIDACDIRGTVYQVPKVTRSANYGLINPTANITFGQLIGTTEVIFRHLPIAAECGTRTSYTVEFNYNNVTNADTGNCEIVNGTCVFPAYGEEAKFTINEYTDSNFNVPVNATTRAQIAGQEIFLSMEVTDLADDLKFAVTECKLIDGGNELVLLSPGALPTDNPAQSCSIPEIGLSGTYDGFTKFNFQHVLFLLSSDKDSHSYTLQCTVEVCNRNDADSLCNRAAAVCMNDAIDATDATAVEEKDRLMKDWMCDGLCGVGNEDQCSVDADVASCKVCTCDYGTGAVGDACLTDQTELCTACETGYTLTGDVCVINSCPCANGVGSTGTACTSSGSDQCASCNAGFTIDGQICRAAIINQPCYHWTDSVIPGRPLPFSYSLPDNQPEGSHLYCAKKCNTNGHRYAGVEYGRECWCGTADLTTHEYNLKTSYLNARYTLWPETSCNRMCVDGTGRRCGDATRMHIFISVACNNADCSCLDINCYSHEGEEAKCPLATTATSITMKTQASSQKCEADVDFWLSDDKNFLHVANDCQAEFTYCYDK